MSEWKELSIRSIIEKGHITIGDGYRAKNSELASSGLPFARAGNINDGFHFEGADCLPEKDIGKVGNKISQPFDIVFTSKGTVGRFAFVQETTRQFVYSPQLCFWRVHNKELISDRWLYFWMHGQEFWEQVHGVKDQTDMAEYVNLNDQRNMKLTLPPLPEQRAIAAVLSSLDDKIDLLHRQNQSLEAMAETLFRQWLVEDVDDLLEKVTLSKLMVISSGKGLKKEQFLENGIYPVLGANGQIGRTNDFLYEEKLIYTGRVGTLGNIFIVNNERVWLSDNTLVIRPLQYFYAVYFVLKISKLEEYNVGSTQPLIRQSDVKDIEFALPPTKVLERFENQASMLFSMISRNQLQIRTLEKLRNTLLPKLLSGEVRIEV